MLDKWKRIAVVVSALQLWFAQPGRADMIRPYAQSQSLTMVGSELWVAVDVSGPHVAQRGYLFRFNPAADQWHLERFDNPVLSIAASDTTVWVGTYGGGVIACNGDHRETFTVESTSLSRTPPESGLHSNYIDAVHPARDRLYCGTDEGLSVLDLRSRTWSHFGSANSKLPAHTVFSITGHDSTIWIAASDYGEAYYEPVSEDEVNEHGGVVRIDRLGKNWVVFTGTQRRVDKNGASTRLVGEIPANNSDAHVVSVDSLGRVWIALKEQVAVLAGNAWTILDSLPPDHPGQGIIDIDAGVDAVWIATHRGLVECKYADDSRHLHPLESEQSIPGDLIEGVCASPDGIWVRSRDLVQESDRGFDKWGPELARRQELKDSTLELQQGLYDPRYVEYLSLLRDGNWRSRELTSRLLTLMAH